MAPITVPTSGLTLLDAFTPTPDDTNKMPQMMKLDLPEGTLEEIFKSARLGGKGMNVTFGKTIVINSLHYH